MYQHLYDLNTRRKTRISVDIYMNSHIHTRNHTDVHTSYRPVVGRYICSRAHVIRLQSFYMFICLFFCAIAHVYVCMHAILCWNVHMRVSVVEGKHTSPGRLKGNLQPPPRV